MKNLLIAGWRGVSHSYAMVNQHQILALARRNDIALHHVDMPWVMPHWNKRDHASGFSAEEDAIIEGLLPEEERTADCVYRICSPVYPPAPGARKTLTFCVTELGYEPTDLRNPQQDLTEFTQGENLVVTPSRWSRDRLLDYGFAEGKVRVVRHGVALTTLHPLTTDELALQRQSLGIPDDAVVFLNLGVATWNKGIDLLIRAFAAVHRKNPNTRLILKDARGLYGLSVETILKSVSQNSPGLLTAEVLSAIMVISTNLSQAELRLLYGFVDWYVSPYRAEGFNLPVLEAQACGTPVIVSSGGSTDDFCTGSSARKIATVFRRGTIKTDQEFCWLEPEVEILEKLMARAVEEGPNKSIESSTLRQAARKNAEQYTWDSVAQILASLI